MALANGPQWAPPGTPAPESQWRYSLERNGWTPPGKKSHDDHTQLVQPLGWNPKDRSKQYQIVVSPPGVTPPPGAYSWTPGEGVHAPGTNPPIDKLSLSLVPAGNAVPPVGLAPPAGGGMSAGPAPAPVPQPPGAGPPSSAPAGPPPSFGPAGGGGTPPPSGMMGPGAAAPPLAPGSPPIMPQT